MLHLVVFPCRGISRFGLGRLNHASLHDGLRREGPQFQPPETLPSQLGVKVSMTGQL